ncbi:MAG: class I SAM-dependent methyltransferase [Chloroflexi bacterium]|nr:MAG: class I SAM-dependent methyltransferase [Chloroflexota bacterium]
MNFPDHFSKLARQYARYRPRYPDDLYAFLSAVVHGHELAWDCGTGSGQAAVGLANYFDIVIATDASEDQIAHAAPHPKVEYRQEKSENVSLPDASCDLVTVAVAVHWFDLPLFYQEVWRVLKPGGVLAVWGYSELQITPEIDKIILEYQYEVLDGYWPDGIHYLFEKYRTLPFPFQELPHPEFNMTTHWNLDELTGFLASWSAAQKYMEAKGHHPLEQIWSALSAAWGDEEQKKEFHWPLHTRIGRKM